jgi:hypothetical protein
MLALTMHIVSSVRDIFIMVYIVNTINNIFVITKKF